MTPTTIAITIIAVLAVAGWVAISRSRQARSHAAVPADVQAAQRNFILVVLRRAPAVLRPEAVAAAAQSAWTGRFGANEDGSEYVERGVPGVMYVLQAHGNAFTVFGAEKARRTLQPPTIFLPESSGGVMG